MSPLSFSTDSCRPGKSNARVCQWDQEVTNEYGFVQGPGARFVVMVPTFDGKMYEWFSDASELELSFSDFESNQGQTLKLEQFLAEAVKYAPGEAPGGSFDVEPSTD